MATSKPVPFPPRQPGPRDLASGGAETAPRPLGPDSFMWRDFGSYLFHLMLPQAFLMQSAHPVVNAAVSKQKKYKNDPWGRARASTKLLWPVVYARPEKAIAMGMQLREMHRRIQGVDAHGRAYSAIDPEAYAWVHLTGFYTGIKAHELFGTPPTPAERARMFEEFKQVGALLSVDPKYIPETEAEYWEMFHRMIAERLERTEALEDILDPNFYAGYPQPPRRAPMHPAVWKLLATGWSRFMYRLTVATLPDQFRAKFGIPYRRRDQLLFRAFATAVRTLYPRTPESMRYIPLAWRAITDARQHPEAYRYPEAPPAVIEA